MDAKKQSRYVGEIFRFLRRSRWSGHLPENYLPAITVAALLRLLLTAGGGALYWCCSIFAAAPAAPAALAAALLHC